MKVINENYNNSSKELEIDFIIEDTDAMFTLSEARKYISEKYKIDYINVKINYFSVFRNKVFCYFDLEY